MRSRAPRTGEPVTFELAPVTREDRIITDVSELKRIQRLATAYS